MSLDEGDNDLATFLSYILAAVRAQFPDATLATTSLLQALISPPVETLATSLSNDLHQLDADFLLVLDDFHFITDPQIHELLGYLLRHPPARMHLVIAIVPILPGP